MGNFLGGGRTGNETQRGRDWDKGQTGGTERARGKGRRGQMEVEHVEGLLG